VRGNPRAVVLVAAGVLAIAGLLVGCGSGDGGAAPTTETPEAPAGAETAQPAPEGDERRAAAPLSRALVTVYFPSASVGGLLGENREIFNTSPVERAKQILSDVIAGPEGPDALPALPAGTRLRQVFVLESGVAYADFSAQLRDGMSGGSQTELLAVYAIVNSVALNVPEIRRVGILVEGEPCESLNGHVDLRHPLAPKPSLTAVGESEII
jgi:spore germination protein GerM